VSCVSCGNVFPTRFQNVTQTFKKSGYGHRCQACKAKNLSEAKKGVFYGERKDSRAIRSSETLVSYGLKDTSQREIKQTDRVDVVCLCGKEGTALFNNLRATYKKYGISWRCHECACKAISSSREGRFFGEENSFFGKKHSQETKDKSAAKYMQWIKTKEGQEFLARHAEQERIRMLSCPNPMDNPVLRSKAIANSSGSNNKVMKKFKEMLTNRGFEFKMNISLGSLSEEFPELKGQRKNWDFLVYKDSKPAVVIDIDGLFYHGHTCDPFYKAQMSAWRDSARMLNLPYGIRVVIVDEDKIEDGFRETLSVFDKNYDAWIEEIYQSCKSSPFPYPQYSAERMKTDWKNLKRMNEYLHGAYPCNSIITNFHKSIYSSRKKGQPSPIEAWNSPELLKKLILNRFIYKSSLSSYTIARGFESSYIAPRVSVFQPGLARKLLSEYASDAKTCVDPFSGFSGRMLGATSLGMSYTGYEIREECAVESNEIIRFLGLMDASVTCSDSLNTIDETEYDVLITCPPYKDKEVWNNDMPNLHTTDYYVKKCLDNFKAKKYIFIVDEPGVYADHVISTLDNKSHITSSKEKIVIITAT
jgi:hypothetical protein